MRQNESKIGKISKILKQILKIALRCRLRFLHDCALSEIISMCKDCSARATNVTFFMKASSFRANLVFAWLLPERKWYMQNGLHDLLTQRGPPARVAWCKHECDALEDTNHKYCARLQTLGLFLMPHKRKCASVYGRTTYWRMPVFAARVL